MLRPIDHVQHQRRRHHAAAARQVVLGKGPQGDRLGLDAERVGAECRHGVERLHVTAAGLQHSVPPFDARRVAGRRLTQALPLQPHPPEPTIIAGRHLELERVGVEENAAGLRDVEHHHAGRLVLACGDHQFERRRAREAVGIPPGQREPRFPLDDLRRRADHRPLDGDSTAVERGRRELAAGGRHHGDPTPLHRRTRAAADVLPPRPWPL